MLKRNKKILALGLGVFIISSALVGCGSDEKTGSVESNKTTTSENNTDATNANNNSAETKKSDANSNDLKENIKNITIGEKVNLTKEETFTVTSVTEGDKVIVKDKTPEEGMKFVAINWTAMNNGSKDASFDSVVSALQIKDKQGIIFKKDNIQIVGENNGDVIPAGQEVQGSYIIQAPKDKSLADLLLLITGGDNTIYQFTLQ